MSVPTPPTLITICTEAVKKAGYTSTSSTQYATILARAESDWIEEVKWDIWHLLKKPTLLQRFGTILVYKGQSRYSLPTDFSSMVSMSLMHGNTTGTAQAAAAGTITLAAGDTNTSDFVDGKEIVCTGGTTGSGQIAQIRTYNATSKVATLAANWGVTPTGTITYMLIDSYNPMTELPVWKFDGEVHPDTRGKPNYYFPIGDNDNGEVLVTPTPDDAYVIKIRYYYDLTRMDLDFATDATIIAVYRRWKNVLLQGVYAKCLQFANDERYPQELSVYNNLLQALAMRENYGNDLSNLVMTVSD